MICHISLTHTGGHGSGIDELGIVAHYNPSIQGLRQEDCCELKDSLAYLTMSPHSTTKSVTEMVQRMQGCVAKSDGLSLILGPTWWQEREPTLGSCPLAPHVHTHEIKAIRYFKV